MTMTMLMKSLVTCHTFGVTSSLTRALLGPVSPRVGCGIKMGQARYTAQISVPTTVQYFSYNTSTLSTLQRRLPYNALAARLCALCPPQCAHTLHSRLSHYLDRIWRGTNWKSPKYAHVPMLPFQPSNQCDTILLPDALSCERNAFYNQAFGNQCPQCTETNCLGLQKALFVVNVSISPPNPYILYTQKWKYRKSFARLDIV